MYDFRGPTKILYFFSEPADLIRDQTIDIERPKIDCLSVVMCPLLAQLKTGFFSIFFAAAVYSTTKQTRQALSSL
jgi:hypothetical protein